MKAGGRGLLGGRALLVVAAAAEARAVLRGLGAPEGLAGREWVALDAGRHDVVASGVGKANAAGAVASCFDAARHRAVVNLGVAGALPREGGAARIGAVVLAAPSFFADEGVMTPQGFVDIAASGFPLTEGAGVAFEPDGALAGALAAIADETGPVATVSTCSGTDELAAVFARRWRAGAIAEAMEGAAAAVAAARLGAPYVEVRVISNTTGDRARQRWDLRAALDRLAGVASAL